jgi:hypothetical protein
MGLPSTIAEKNGHCKGGCRVPKGSGLREAGGSPDRCKKTCNDVGLFLYND